MTVAERPFPGYARPVPITASIRSGAGPEPRRRKHTRDRRGRGLRGPLAPPQVPLALTRAEQFDELVLDAVERLERRWPRLSEVELAVEEVPPADAEHWSEEAVPLGRVLADRPGEPVRIVIYRRPVEARAAGRPELADLVYEVVVEQVAELMGIEPDEVDQGRDEE
ncbi:metallopeptidase family protein [Catenulispora yoronensis]|uniref:Metallopeptidase family protein n=1 Tax=Catenulispora yoronensis TaxID=450799 RepID=A0ABN2V9J2_9ACTN